ASRITPVVSVSAIAIASIITVGILFMMEEIIAAMKPIAMVATNKPCSALASITRAKTSVRPAFLSPNTTTYIPIEKKTIAHGAPVITAFVSTASLFLAITKKKIATIPATIETGMLINSLTKYPINSMTSTYHERRNNFKSLVSAAGFFSLDTSYVFGILFLKYSNNTKIVATSENKFGIIILEAYSTKPILKKSADTMLTKLLTTNGKEVVSAINPLAIINGNTIFSLKFKFRTIASTIGVSINAAPSLAKKAATIAPKILT